MNWTDLIDQVDWEIHKGKGEWKEYPDVVVYYYKGKKIWQDDFQEANDLKAYNTMLESFKEDMFELEGKTYSQWFEEYVKEEL